MQILKERLAKALGEAHFDFEYDDVRGDGTKTKRSHRNLSVEEFASIYASQQYRAGSKRADCHVPDRTMLSLIAGLRNALERFIEPNSDRLGHAFPIDNYRVIRNSGGKIGICHTEFESTPEDFSESLLRAAAIMSVEKTIELLARWIRGEPVRFKTSTLVNGLTLNDRHTLLDEIEIAALPLTTEELPRLPDRRHQAPGDYLGRSVLSINMSASPTLFRPKSDTHEGTVKARTDNGVDFDTVCHALSLLVNSHVSKTFLWSEHAEAAPFCLLDWITMGDNALDYLWYKSKGIDSQTGAVSIKRLDEASISRLDKAELSHMIEALMHSNEKLRIAVDRWRRSIRSGSAVVDRYIDLRIALETLYLQDFANGRSTEMRFRLSLFGAWHLGITLDERRKIRKILRDAYDNASAAVHGGKAPKNNGKTLMQAQTLCRKGILKLLREGPPADWGDLVLGTGH